MAEDSELWDVICDDPFIPMKTIGEPAVTVPKSRKEYSDADRKSIEKNFRAKKILICGIGQDEYNRILACQSAKEIWEALQTAHEGTTQVKQSKIDMLTTEYELFKMKDDESIQDIHTRFTSIINELHSLGEIIPRNKLDRKTLSVLPSSWERKVNAIMGENDLQKLTIDELIGNLKTYEMKKKKDHERREPKREKNLVLKIDNNESSDEGADMAYLTKRFQNMVRRIGGIPKKGSSSKPRGYYLCHKCGNPVHFIKDCPLLKQDQYKHNIDKITKRNPVPDKRFKRKEAVDNVVKQAPAAWGDSSMMAVKSEGADYDSIFALMAKSDDDDDNDDDEVNFLGVQRNLKSYSQKELISLGNILIDAYHNLINDKNSLTIELGEVENERDGLVVIVADLKETIENLVKEKSVLMKKVENIENERDDLLVIIMDLKETTEKLKRGNSSETVRKGKEVASEIHIKLENELQSVKSSLCAELERNRQLQEDLGRAKNDLEKSLKWTWFSDTIAAMYTSNGGNMQGVRFQREKTPYNPHSKYVTVPDTVFALTVETLVTLKKTGAVKGSSQKWYMDSGCSKHMTGNIDDFLSLKALQGGSVSFDNGKKGYILGVGRIGKSLTHSIENVYYVNGLKYSLLSVSQICDKGNKVEFVSKICTVTNLVTGEVVLMEKRYKNIYVADFESLQSGDLSCLSDVDNDAEL
ncbi:COP1-interactive protein 1-like [Nicotiana tomentosiformis]|uniref:COP1-interactive protein 1-like n=1 Tax=Nicotiana tomentosiformis TaxID=4098 RepID=UPI00388C9DE9